MRQVVGELPSVPVVNFPESAKAVLVAFLPLPDVYLIDAVLVHDIKVVFESLSEEAVDVPDWME